MHAILPFLGCGLIAAVLLCAADLLFYFLFETDAVARVWRAARFVAGSMLTMADLVCTFVCVGTVQLLQPTQDGGPHEAVINFIVQIVIMIVAAVLANALAPKPPKPKPPSLDAFDVPTAEEGRPLPVVFGEVIVRDPNVVWWGDLATSPIKKKLGKK